MGNTRVIFSDTNNDDVPEILQEADYYPFGMRHQNATATNHYLYNGKELNTDLGLDWYDYGFRWYDAEIGRFPSVDPIIENFPDLTPYNYASNNPSTLIDLWGLQGVNPNPILEPLHADEPTQYLNQALNEFALDFEEARAATLANNGREYGYGIFADSGGNLHLTNRIAGSGAENVVEIATYVFNVWDGIRSDRLSDNLSKVKTGYHPTLFIVGIYHTHPDMGVDGDPISIGDAKALLQTSRQAARNYGGFALGTGFFAIADDINGGRYAFVVEDANTTAESAMLLYNDFRGNNPPADNEVNNMEGETTGDQYRAYFPAKFFGSGIGLYYNDDNAALILNRLERDQRIIRD